MDLQTIIAGQPLVKGDILIHDPSRVVRHGEFYYMFSTGPGVRIRRSKDLLDWKLIESVFQENPIWRNQTVPGKTDTSLWAPDVIYFNGLYHVYYSVSTWGSNVSAIGLATNPELNPDSSDYCWTDCGPVVVSAGTNYNAIDPCPIFDENGNLWLVFGSFFSGIKMVSLNNQTGMRISGDDNVYPLANRPGVEHNPIEAPYMIRLGDYYYMFTNWDFCCRGAESTYNIRVARSKEITGPYLDRDGVDTNLGGGSLFLGTNGEAIGPGQIGFIDENLNYEELRFVYHYYDSCNNGRSTLGSGRMRVNADGWPIIVQSI